MWDREVLSTDFSELDYFLLNLSAYNIFLRNYDFISSGNNSSHSKQLWCFRNAFSKGNMASSCLQSIRLGLRTLQSLLLWWRRWWWSIKELPVIVNRNILGLYKNLKIYCHRPFWKHVCWRKLIWSTVCMCIFRQSENLKSGYYNQKFEKQTNQTTK